MKQGSKKPKGSSSSSESSRIRQFQEEPLIGIKHIVILILCTLLAIYIFFVVLAAPAKVTRRALRTRVRPTRRVATRSNTPTPTSFDIYPRQCSANYQEEGTILPPDPQMYNLTFCKFFDRDPHVSFAQLRPWYKRFCKSFAGDDACYCLTETSETVWHFRYLTFGQKFMWYFRAVKKEYPESLEWDPERFFFRKIANLHHYPCSAIPFVDRYPKDMPQVAEGTYDFLYSVAIVYSEECEDIQYIPALFSPKQRICIYGDGVAQPQKVSKECAVICDNDPPEDAWSDLWYDSNVPAAPA